MKNYRLLLEAEFITPAASSSTLRQKVHKLLKDNDFDEKNFEISISLVKGQNVEAPSVEEKDGNKARKKRKATNKEKKENATTRKRSGKNIRERRKKKRK